MDSERIFDKDRGETSDWHGQSKDAKANKINELQKELIILEDKLDEEYKLHSKHNENARKALSYEESLYSQSKIECQLMDIELCKLKYENKKLKKQISSLLLRR